MTVLRVKFGLLILTLVVIVFGAYVRLTDAGLGCPDWPGCYGNLIPNGAEGFKNTGAYDSGKAWREMIHRYLAGFLGLGIIGLGIYSLKEGRGLLSLEFSLVPLVLLQSILGMFTVTLLLQPLIVSAHLLGGMTILAVLWWSVLRESKCMKHRKQSPDLLKTLGWITFIALIIQIFLGGWTSTNYAALACTDFPTCQGELIPPVYMREAFTFWRGGGIDYEHGILDSATRTTIHFVHRFWALVTALLITALFVTCVFVGDQKLKFVSLCVFIAMIVQVVLGISNILLGLPLAVAVAHNGGAALLILALLTLLYSTVQDNSQDGS